MSTATPNSGSELRQRGPKAGSNGTAAKPASSSSSASTPSSESPVSFLDICRALAGIALVSTIASYAVTQGKSLSWGLYEKKPWWMDVAEVRKALKGPLLLTNDELAAYDGSDPSKPILLALNRTIYDVSSSPAVYGPGGPYSQLAAKDASRSYITTCFDPSDDLVPYFGGVEEVYVPLWLSRKPLREELDAIQVGNLFGNKDAEDLLDDVRKKVGRKHIKGLQEKAYERAKERVREQVRTWETMFEKKNYAIVGRVVGVDEEDPTKWRHLGFCDEARKLRPGLGETMSEAMEAVGKGDKMQLNIGRMMGSTGQIVEKKKSKKDIKKEHMAKKNKDKDQQFKDDMGLGGGTETPQALEDAEDEDGEGGHDDELANTKIEDMLQGGKYYGGDKKIAKDIEELMKETPDLNDPEAVQRALTILRRRKSDKDEEKKAEDEGKKEQAGDSEKAQAKAEEL